MSKCDDDDDVNDNDDDSVLEVPVQRKEMFTDDSCKSICFVCRSSVSEPYIRCAICSKVDLCPNCFVNGREKGSHKNDHDYMIVRYEFRLIKNSNWTAKEEMMLLNLILECGIGNWDDISKRMLKKRSPDECKKHYFKHFIDEKFLNSLPKSKGHSASVYGSETVPYRFKLDNIDDPPRYKAFTNSSNILAGYNAARSDFQINFDDDAESWVAKLKYDHFMPGDSNFETAQELQTAIVSAYNERLKERHRRRKIIRDHGLISSRKNAAFYRIYENAVCKPGLDRLKIFSQLINGTELDYLLTGLLRIGELKSQLGKLYGYRENGLQYFHSIAIFEELTKQREEALKERRSYLNSTDCNWKNVLASEVGGSNSGVVPTTAGRKKPPPLAVKGMPDFEKLTKEEQELCSNHRLFPSHFLEYKHLLVNENKKMGYVKLAQARNLLKIDVNKTRKIYDFLIDCGHISSAFNS